MLKTATTFDEEPYYLDIEALDAANGPWFTVLQEVEMMEPRLTIREAASIASLLAPLANEKSLMILEGVIQGLSPSQITLQFDIPRSTVHEYITTLTETAYIVRTEHGYAPTDLGLRAMGWLVISAKPCIQGYLTLLDAGTDLRNLRAVGQSIHKLSMKTEEEGYARGLQILRELEREWFRAMQTVSTMFEMRP